MEPDFHNLIRLVVIGDDGVGKTSVLRKFVDHRYSDVYMPTIGVDFLLPRCTLSIFG
ncbi:hypothetical protein PTSG_09845 [Salpingoeca rosetta]|uniref:Uncharacterized protein n=1 Tax=Salpingoeca rosetta (strain ATCC 50818 / BSB-021) TaxID=946362 RepID=F2UNB3_SALR5|nr:uncharacterized protein PTSG_09845 [Salpingoeca rosetta]EGD79118.1 hypothetical protein PTSG_09845 [Salpingoeca rosetta]|eukprot:XP_004989203.1 hypothetical protein PTSG_09845 [Salpingoeca rosetta]